MSRALSRGLAVIEALAQADEHGLGPSAVAETIGIDKATSTRILRTLIETEYVSQNEMTRRYRLTGKILRLAQGVANQLDLRSVARPHLRQLNRNLDETIHLGVMQEFRVIYVDKLESTKSIQLVSALGQALPLHSTSLGKAMLAALPDGELRTMVNQLDFESSTEHTITSPAAFLADIRRTRERGFSVDDRENEVSGAGVAAAILDASGRPVGAIGVAGPEFRIRDSFNRLGEAARDTARAISRDLGAKTG